MVKSNLWVFVICVDAPVRVRRGDCLPFLIKSDSRIGLSSISGDHERGRELKRDVCERKSDREEECKMGGRGRTKRLRV